MASMVAVDNPSEVKLRVVMVPVLQDNYAYLIVDVASSTCAVVDPAEPDKVLAAAKREGLTITMVLTTHKHWDHAGGNKAIADAVPGVAVIGSSIDNVEACNRPVEDEEVVQLGSLPIRCMLTPGHTRGHMSYYVDTGELRRAVFTGDCLFVCGCGRVFEGTAADMVAALYGKLAPLPPETEVWCGHEYTDKNFAFALTVESEAQNPAMHERARWVTMQRQLNLPTIPSTMALEVETNPFMRCGIPAVQEMCGTACIGSVEKSFAKIRLNKDNF